MPVKQLIFLHWPQTFLITSITSIEQQCKSKKVTFHSVLSCPNGVSATIDYRDYMYGIGNERALPTCIVIKSNV